MTEQEANNKASALQQCNTRKDLRTACGELRGGGLMATGGRQSLRDAVEQQLGDAELAVYRANQLAELRGLLDKNPDVARILDLVEVVRR